VSDSGVFWGGAREHERCTLPLGEVLSHSAGAGHKRPRPSLEGETAEACGEGLGLPPGSAVYLAQAPVFTAEASHGEEMLSGLLPDLPTPGYAPWVGDGEWDTTRLLQVNLWAALGTGVKGSVHFDDYDNLLAVVTGEKEVALASPRAPVPTRTLADEEPNHSPATPEEFEVVAEYVGTVSAGDALFIPEGWWHCVRSAPGTLAANFWFESFLAKAVARTSSRYLARRLLRDLANEERERLLVSVPVRAGVGGGSSQAGPRDGLPTESQGLTALEQREMGVLLEWSACWAGAEAGGEGESLQESLRVQTPGVVFRTLGPLGTIRVLHAIASAAASSSEDKVRAIPGTLFDSLGPVDVLCLTDSIEAAASTPGVSTEMMERFNVAFYGSLGRRPSDALRQIMVLLEDVNRGIMKQTLARLVG